MRRPRFCVVLVAVSLLCDCLGGAPESWAGALEAGRRFHGESR